MNPKHAKAKSANPHHIFLTAEAFSQACQVLAENIPEQEHLTRSIVIGTNAALTLELYLKCLLVLEHGTYIEEHNLEEVFRLLSRQTKESLERKWKLAVAETESLRQLELEGVGNLQTLIRLGKDSFVKFRYAFEKDSIGTLWALGGLMPVVRDLILYLHPEWKDQ